MGIAMRGLAMKPKIGVYLTRDVAKLLKLAVKRSGATKSDIVNEALLRHLGLPRSESDPNEAVLHRLNCLANGIRRLHRDVAIMTETLALHIRQFLMIVSPVPTSEQQEAKRLGRERYEVFLRQVAKRIASDKGMVLEVMERIAETNGDRLVPPIGDGAIQRDASQQQVASHG
jgi:hypothetical protein